MTQTRPGLCQKGKALEFGAKAIGTLFAVGAPVVACWPLGALVGARGAPACRKATTYPSSGNSPLALLAPNTQIPACTNQGILQYVSIIAF